MHIYRMDFAFSFFFYGSMNFRRNEKENIETKNTFTSLDVLRDGKECRQIVERNSLHEIWILISSSSWVRDQTIYVVNYIKYRIISHRFRPMNHFDDFTKLIFFCVCAQFPCTNVLCSLLCINYGCIHLHLWLNINCYGGWTINIGYADKSDMFFVDKVRKFTVHRQEREPIDWKSYFTGILNLCGIRSIFVICTKSILLCVETKNKIKFILNSLHVEWTPFISKTTNSNAKFPGIVALKLILIFIIGLAIDAEILARRATKPKTPRER